MKDILETIIRNLVENKEAIFKNDRGAEVKVNKWIIRLHHQAAE